MASTLRSLGVAVLSSGFNPRSLRHLKKLRRYFSDLKAFIAKGGRVDVDYPILTDFDSNAGSGSGQYFHQDLLVAQFIHDAKPARHLDIGSRIDGFVAHVATFRPVEVIDIRPMRPSVHPNIRYAMLDLIEGDVAAFGQADSVSCLHAIEHFGLGRYGDPLDPDGHKHGFANIARLVAPGGRLYISFPVGRKTEVYFNAHRCFAARDIFDWGEAIADFNLERFDWVDEQGELRPNGTPEDAAEYRYVLGIYTLRRNS